MTSSDARLLSLVTALAALTLLPNACVLDLDDLSTGGAGGAATTSSGTGGGTAGTGGAPPVTGAQLQALAANCVRYPGSTDFAPVPGDPSTVPVCTLPGAVWWTSGMSIACDGGSGTPCKTSAGYSQYTAGTDSKGNPLDASTLPFIVVPSPSNGFDFSKAGLTYGSVAAVIYKDRLVYAIVGDEGGDGDIGEGSYALAAALGIDNNPQTGGVASGVTYIVFTGTAAVVAKNEDASEAQQLGAQLAQTLVAGD